MAAMAKRARWQEEEALSAHRMLSLHQRFQLLASQLSQADMEALQAGLLAEDEDEGERSGPGPALSPVPGLPPALRMLLELERSGRCDEANLRELLHLLRLIRRQDLLPCVGPRSGPAVSPERCSSGGPVSRVGEQVESCLNTERADATQTEWRSGASLGKRQSTNRRRGRGAGKRRGRKGHVLRNHEQRESPHQPRATCDIRLRVRAVYSDQNTVLRGNVVSVKQDPLDRCFDLFGQANTILKSRDLGSIICDIKFSELSYLDAFWNDYINGSLLEALKGVFITDSLKQAVGQEAIQLLVNVDEDDYEKGRRVLLQNISP
ncbi:DNA-binding death effector domain-containing protein 2-like [Mustelus asterias]